MLRVIFGAAMVLCMLPAFSQPVETGNWLMYFGQNKVSKDFSIHTEVQYRNHTAIPVNIEQLLLRTGLNYHFAPSAFVTAGYGYISSYVFDSERESPESEEHRIWQQLILNQKVGRFKFEHRYRVEQRWVNGNYLNRLRYRLMFMVPVNKPTFEKGTWYLSAYDEVFMNTERDFFDRNRLYGAVGYQFNKNMHMQTGMLQQQLNDFGKWYLQFAIFINTDFSN